MSFFISTDPEVGFYILVIISIKVVFPAPFLPKMLKIYPAYTSRLNLSRAISF
jgi:hypothetical protein